MNSQHVPQTQRDLRKLGLAHLKKFFPVYASSRQLSWSRSSSGHHWSSCPYLEMFWAPHTTSSIMSFIFSNWGSKLPLPSLYGILFCHSPDPKMLKILSLAMVRMSRVRLLSAGDLGRSTIWTCSTQGSSKVRSMSMSVWVAVVVAISFVQTLGQGSQTQTGWRAALDNFKSPRAALYSKIVSRATN